MVKFPSMLSSIWTLKQAFHGLTRRIQTTVEHMRVTNSLPATAMTRGQVIALTTGKRQAILADATAAATAAWAGIVTEPTPALATGIARINGYALVRFDDSETPVAGNPVYVSDTAGNATTLTDGSYASRIGTIGDATEYVGDSALETYNPFCKVFLQHCCTPTVVPEPG